VSLCSYDLFGHKQRKNFYACLSNFNKQLNRRHHPGHFRDDPVGFMMQMGAFYQGTVSRLFD
jgi:hypothetical protein